MKVYAVFYVNWQDGSNLLSLHFTKEHAEKRALAESEKAECFSDVMICIREMEVEGDEK